jgi:hypothetical protein
MHPSFQTWKVVGIELGTAVIPKEHSHVSTYVDLDFGDGLKRLDPDGGLLGRWKGPLCHTLPDAWKDECTHLYSLHDSTGNRRRKGIAGDVLSGFALSLGLYAHHRINKLDDRLESLGLIVNNTVSRLRQQEVESDVWAVLLQVTNDWGEIGRTGVTTTNFWTMKTKQQILKHVGLKNTWCYVIPRVFEAMSTIRIVGQQAYPRLRVEVRIQKIDMCGQFAAR